MSQSADDLASREYFWGCELSKDSPSLKWSGKPEEEEDDSDYMQHTLFLKHAVLGASAVKDERNIIGVEVSASDGASIKQPVFSLTLGRNDTCFLDVSFGPMTPVTFKLLEGSGPVYLSGQEVLDFPPDGDMSQDEDGLEIPEELSEEQAALEEENEDISPKKAAGKDKKRKAPGGQAAKSKKGKLDTSTDNVSDDDSMDAENDDDEDEDEDDVDEDEDEEEEDESESSPEKASKGKSKGKAKDSKASKGVKKAPAVKKVKPAAKKVSSTKKTKK